MNEELVMKNVIVGRSYDFVLDIIKLVSSLPKNKVSDVIGYQLLKSGTSVGANGRCWFEVVPRTKHK